MDQLPAPTIISRRNEDIALDMMKFIAVTTGYGKTGATASAGFQGGTPSRPDEYAKHLIDLYKDCLAAIPGK
jgi:hypothetical protein